MDLAMSVSVGGKQVDSSSSKTSKSGIAFGRSHSFTRGLVSNSGCVSHHNAKQALNRPARSVVHLCSSRSFSSLNTLSLTAAPFMRSSRSFNRLNQKSSQEDHYVSHSQVNKRETEGKKVPYSSCEGKLSFHSEQLSHLQSVADLDGAGDPNREQSSTEGSQCSTMSLPTTSSTSPPLQHVGVKDASSPVEGAAVDGCTSTTTLSNEQLNIQTKREKREEQQVSPNLLCDRTKVMEMRQVEQKTDLLVKQLQQMQNELSRLQQLNRILQDELQEERESQSRSNLLSNSNLSSGQASAIQRLQKMNHDLRLELEALKSSQEEARESELRRRVDLLAQQAQLLVTGDATALAQAHLEQDRLRFHEQRMEWESRVASLKSQLSISEKYRKEAESCSTQLQQELQSFHILQQEADCLKKNLQEVTTQLSAQEEAQAQKESHLQKHLTLLQKSQDRERRSLAMSLKQAEQHSLDLQERLDRAEEQVGSLNKTEVWNREIEKAQRQLQEELASTVSAMQKLQEERDQLDCNCRQLQSQLSEVDGEVSRLQSRLKTDETQYYNLEHAYERVCEELQVALGKVHQKEADTHEIHEGYEMLLERKEQELSEVLLKMEVLGISLEETEVRLNEVLKVSTCSSPSSLQRDECLEPVKPNEKQQPIDPLTLNYAGRDAVHGDQLSSSNQSVCTVGDDSERFMSVIQTLESKLYTTEEKLRDIMQRLEENKSHNGFQDPHVVSQLTESRASAQHLSLLLHSQAKQSQHFAQETENRSRMLANTFQVALNITHTCREGLRAIPININDFEKQLASVAACLQQGQTDAQKQQQESHNARMGVDKILNDQTLAGVNGNDRVQSDLINIIPAEDNMESLGKCLMRELFVVEKLVSVLQNQHSIKQRSSVPRDDEGDVADRYKTIVLQIIALQTDKCDNSEPLEGAIGKVCKEAELIYASFILLRHYDSVTQVNKQGVEHGRVELAEVNPLELSLYEEQSLDSPAEPIETVESDEKKVDAEKELEWLKRLISRLQRRAECLRKLCQEISGIDGEEVIIEHDWENASAVNVNWMLEQAKWIYLSDRLYLDLEEQLQQCEALQHKLQALSLEQDLTLKDEQEAFNHALYQLQEDNSALREELECVEQKIQSVETGNQRLLEDTQKIKNYHEKRMKNLDSAFQAKIFDLQQIHEEEVKHLQCYYTKSGVSKDTKACTEVPNLSERTFALPDQAALERKTKEEFRNRLVGGDEASMNKPNQKDLEAPSDECFTAMEEMHSQLIDDLQQHHQKDMAALLKEKDQLLQEETAATLSAIVAMRRAHKQELEKSKRSQHIKENANITQLHVEHEKDIQSLHKELEVLSIQHTQKCLENSQLSQDLQADRQSLMKYQREIQELKRKQSSVKRETDEMSQLHLSPNGKEPHVAPQLNDFYEMAVILRAREAEMEFLRHEARALREELKLARMDKIYAQKKFKALFTNSQDKPNHDVKFATWSPGRHASGQSLEDTGTNTSNAAFPTKTDKSSLTHLIQGGRSKSLKEGLSAQERMKLFDSF